MSFGFRDLFALVGIWFSGGSPAADPEALDGVFTVQEIVQFPIVMDMSRVLTLQDKSSTIQVTDFTHIRRLRAARVLRVTLTREG